MNMSHTTQQPLPQGWYEGVDPQYNRVYYFNKRTRSSTWTRPQFDALQDAASEVGDNNPAKMFSPKQSPPSTIHQLNQPKSESYPASSQASPTLSSFASDPWVKVFSPEHKRVYYYNKITRQSVWVDPRVAMKRFSSAPTARDPSIASYPVGSTVPPPSPPPMSQPSTMSREPESVISQIPALQTAWKEIEQARRALEKEREQHDVRMKNEWRNLRVQLKEFSGLNITSDSAAGAGKQDRGAFTETKLNLTEDLEDYAIDIERRTRELAEQAAEAENSKSTTRRTRRRSVEAWEEAASVRNAVESMTGHSQERSSDNDIPKAFAQLAKATSEVSEAGPPIADALAEDLAELQSSIEHMKREVEAQKKAEEDAREVDGKGGYYNILDVRTDCTKGQLKKAYHKMMIKWHPDKNRDNLEEAREMTSLLQAAYEVLSDDWERKVYDALKCEHYLRHAQVITCFRNYLCTGLYVKKVGRTGLKRFPLKRFLWMNQETTIISTSKQRIAEATPEQELKIKSVDLMEVTAIKRGINGSKVLKQYGVKKNSCKYLSIVTPERTLDLQVASRKERDFIASRMELLVSDMQRDFEWVQNLYEKVVNV